MLYEQHTTDGDGWKNEQARESLTAPPAEVRGLRQVRKMINYRETICHARGGCGQLGLSPRHCRVRPGRRRNCNQLRWPYGTLARLDDFQSTLCGPVASQQRSRSAIGPLSRCPHLDGPPSRDSRTQPVGIDRKKYAGYLAHSSSTVQRIASAAISAYFFVSVLSFNT